MLNQDIALDFSYTVFGAILRKNLPTFLKINMPGVIAQNRSSVLEHRENLSFFHETDKIYL